ncbi:hypothetical protein HPULCUR_001146 [Helicostylum pulchrum]|uniref:Uncharacterized protein n=1 Tax=Helicostylum pulchrum TaxID=562976 RepID=A0ABP9XM06_9FUNG
MNLLEGNGITDIIKKNVANIYCLTKKEVNGGEMQDRGYVVRFQVNEDNQLMSLFFCHEDTILEIRKMPEAITIDATYKTNAHRLTFISIVGHKYQRS